VASNEVPAPRAYRSSRRDAQALQTRQRIVDAATGAFLERGFAGTTMRLVASRAGVSVPTVELLFGTKGRLLKAAIDVAIAGDDEPVPVLDRHWTAAARSAETAHEFLTIAAGVIGPAQQRSAGLVLAAFEASSHDPELSALAEQLTAQRSTTAEWIIDQLTRTAPLRKGCRRRDAIDTVWIIMDPAVFDRLTRHRGWTVEQYQRWFADSVGRLLLGEPDTNNTTTRRRRTT
jgi:AcrR family transcriptional regulator